MMTFAYFDSDHAHLVVLVWDATLHFQITFAEADLAGHDDEVIRSGLEAWQEAAAAKTLSAEHVERMREAQTQLIAHVRRVS